ncbi:MAG TPA: hypothetical protein VNO33_23385, partial [Kofleriaceae bacterium]|nr:hypothetical protein [Kofleriaceae bacterium]
MRRIVRVAIAFAISGGVIAALAFQVDWRRAVHALAAAKLGWIAVAIAWSMAIVWARGVRWTVLQPGPGLGI